MSDFLNEIPYVDPNPVAVSQDTSALESQLRERAVERGVEGPIVDSLLPTLVPVLVNMLQGCFKRDVSGDDVKRAMTSDTRRAKAFRLRAVRAAASRRGPRLTTDQKQRVADAMGDVAKDDPASIAALVREETDREEPSFDSDDEA